MRRALGLGAVLAMVALVSPVSAQSPSAAGGDAAPERLSVGAEEVATPSKLSAEQETSASSAEMSAAAGGAPAAAEQSAPAKPAPQPVTTLEVRIDLAQQEMTVREGGEVQHVWPISSGRSGYATPRGTFHPQRLARMWYSRKYDNSPMPHSIFFHGGFAIHGTSYVKYLGRPASHGCVRLAPPSAAALYKLVQRHGMTHTRIVLHGQPKLREPAIAGRDGQGRDARSYGGRGQPRYDDYYASGQVYSGANRRPGHRRQKPVYSQSNGFFGLFD